MQKIETYLYEKTGMYIDWDQLKHLPEINTLIDIGVGKNGTPNFYERFNKSKLLLIDPLIEAKQFALEKLTERDYEFFLCAVGEKISNEKIKVEENIGRSSLLNVTEINYEGKPVSERMIEVKTVDSITNSLNDLGEIGIKIDTEGYELNVVKGAVNTLKNTKFVIAEVRHNYESFEGQYSLHEFISFMFKNNFILTRIITAKPLIADLCFQPINALNKIR